ncbi:hypothetical protein [Nocardia nepalensis]|uniref:hypothetical protein n=1 Tax=Nocardia nepalensis TaxID=3375448 RepID=UPI003B67E653
MADRVKQHMLDRLLRIAAERAGAPSGLRFTERQLYYEVCRILTPLHRIPRRFAFTVPAPLPYASFRVALERHGELPGLLTPAPPRATRAGLHTPEPDLFDYGLPRLLVCESDAIAQMLRANGLPMESACPVLSAAELPLDPGVASMLARVEGTIYLLHDASAEGLTFPARLAHLTDIPDGVRVVPLGLRPRQAGALHLTHRRNPATTTFAAQVDPCGHTTLGRPTLSAEAAQADSWEREREASDPGRAPGVGPAPVDSWVHEGSLRDEVPSGTVAQADSWERQESDRAPASGVRAAEPDSWEHEGPSLAPATSGPAAQVDPWRHATLGRPTLSAEVAQADSWERQESDPRPAPGARAAEVGSREHEGARRAQVPSATVVQLDPWERAWLHRGRFVEVEAVRPASLLRTVHRLVREVRPHRTTMTELRRARNAGFLTWPAA